MSSVSVNTTNCLTVNRNGCSVCLAALACLHHNVGTKETGRAYIIDPAKCGPCLDANQGICAASRGCAAEIAITKTRQGHETSGLCSNKSAFDLA